MKYLPFWTSPLLSSEGHPMLPVTLPPSELLYLFHFQFCIQSKQITEVCWKLESKDDMYGHSPLDNSQRRFSPTCLCPFSIFAIYLHFNLSTCDSSFLRWSISSLYSTACARNSATSLSPISILSSASL